MRAQHKLISAVLCAAQLGISIRICALNAYTKRNIQRYLDGMTEFMLHAQPWTDDGLAIPSIELSCERNHHKAFTEKHTASALQAFIESRAGIFTNAWEQQELQICERKETNRDTQLTHICVNVYKAHN